MKQLATLLGLFLCGSLYAQTVFVRSNASGANNGTSWADAYTNLDAALANAAPGQSIWVAAGTYKPGAPAPNHSFIVPTGISLYGGFMGNETALNQRNAFLNITTLSGDIAGNDVVGNFTQNRTDNSIHVIIVFDSGSPNEALIDGFVVRSGHTLVGSSNTDLNRRGGGLLASGKLTLRNCRFTDNFGESGAGAVAIGSASNGLIVDNCIFEANTATQQGILYLRETPNSLVKNCVFRNNTTNRGVLYPQMTVNMTIDSCLFEGNDAGTNFGSAMFSWQANWTLSNSIIRKNKSANAGIYIDDRDGGHFVTIDNCLFERDTTTGFGGSGVYGWQVTGLIKNSIFRDNYAPNAAAMYFNGREFDSSFSVDNCLFERNVTTSYGGTAIYHNRTNYTMSNSIFRGNTAPSSGAALYHGDTTVFYINNCMFDGNQANYAAAIANYGIGCKGTFDACTFVNNRAGLGGGAVSNGFKADVAYKNCLFQGNEASFGGAIFTQNDTTRLTVENCAFTENVTSGSGGCIFVNSRIAASIKGSEFFYNTGDFGGAINANGDSLLTIENTVFRDNFALTQGGALNLNQANAVITNCLFARNLNLASGVAGAISINASNELSSTVTARNCTFADNEAGLGGGIAQWEAPLGTAKLYLQNCLFQNPFGENYAIEEGEPEVFSLNGNQSSDGSFEGLLNGDKDVHNLGTSFADPDADDYRLTGGPAVDGGVAEGAPLTDLLGNPRIGLPDRGCYEFGTSSLKNVGFVPQPMTCSPNPATDRSLLNFESAQNGMVEIVVWAQSGQRTARFHVEKSAQEFSFALNLSDWPAGSYRVQCFVGSALHEGLLVKI